MPKPIQYLVWSFQDFAKDNGPQWAAALAYYALMSVFPLMLAALSIAAMFVDVDWVLNQATRLSQSFLPTGSDFVRSTIEGIFEARGPTSIVSIALLLWSGSAIFGVATQALNIAFGVDEKLGFIQRAAIQLAMAVTLGLLLIAALASSAIIGLAWRFLGLGEGLTIVRTVLQFLVQGLLLLLVFYLAYRFVPRTAVHSRSAWFGALFAALLFVVIRPAFSFYIARFSNYNAVYGALAILIILVLWAWISATIFLLGGQLAALVEGLDYQGKTRADVVQHHEQRSPVRRIKEAIEKRT